MYTDNFIKAVEFVLKNEGGYTIDEGGETNFGISKNQYEDIDIKNLTKSDAIYIYYRDYWLQNNLDLVKDSNVSTTLLDFVVNSGKAPFIIQEVLNNTFQSGLYVDGIIGKKTIGSINSVSSRLFLNELNTARLNYLKSLKNWVKNSRGWTIRVKKNLALINKNVSILAIVGVGLIPLYFLVKNM